jgi:hypothetical protein
MAAENDSVQALKKIWKWAEEVTACQVIAETVHSVVSEKRSVRVKEDKMNARMLKNKLLLAKDRDGNTIWHQAAVNGREQVLETLCTLAKEVHVYCCLIKIRN